MENFCSVWKPVSVPKGGYFYGNFWSFRAGRNDKTTHEYKDYRWKRARLGIPLKAITIDKGSDVREWHMFLEGWFWLNLAFWFVLWVLYLMVVAIYCSIKRRHEGKPL